MLIQGVGLLGAIGRGMSRELTVLAADDGPGMTASQTPKPPAPVAGGAGIVGARLVPAWLLRETGGTGRC